MQMRKILEVLLIAAMLIIGGDLRTNAQYVIREADAQYDLFNYEKAIALYNRAYQKKATLYTAEKLAECYNNVRDFKQTERWSAISAGLAPAKAEDALVYAKALQQNSKYSEARTWYTKYSELKNDVNLKQLNNWLLSCDSAVHWMIAPVPVTITNEKALNTPQSDWGTAIYQHTITFASDRAFQEKKTVSSKPFLKFDGSRLPDKNIYGWTGNQYLKLYQTNATIDSVELFPVHKNSDYHIGPATFTADEKEMYFTLTRIPKKPTYVKGKPATLNIEIFSSKKAENGEWSVQKAFPYNNVNEYSVGDPFISTDGRSLYFVSNMPGGRGGTDLYVSQRTAEGEWGVPLNLIELNTEGNERTPFLDAQANFYYSSDGGIGMGGLDIFKAKLRGGKMVEITNLGYPINSPQDDLAYLVTGDRTGYLSSNRSDGMGDDDIYSFKPFKALATPVIDKDLDTTTKKPVVDVLVSLQRIKNIYYDFDRSNIRKDAALELDKLVIILKDNPTLWLELGSHTDSRGNDAYNMWLSQRRADAAVHYLINKGIEKDRITAKGYGETELLNKCANGVSCSEEEHQLNRRTEFKIVK